MDVFTTVAGVVIAAVALFVGYRVGLKDGFRGGFQSGRTLERQLAVEQRKYLAARAVKQEALLQSRAAQRSLPMPDLGAIETDEYVTEAQWRAGGDPQGGEAKPYEGRRY